MPPLRILIEDVCTTRPEKGRMAHGRYDTVTWKTTGSGFFILLLPGGVFKGHADDFPWPIFGPFFSIPLELADPLPDPIPPIRNYIYDTSGKNCSRIIEADPPEIIIESRRIRRKKPGKTASKKK